MGKLGLPVALAIESRGHTVCGYDLNPEVKEYLDSRFIPFREEGLQSLLNAHDILWQESIEDVVRDSEIVFVSIQTPHAPEYEGVSLLPDTRADFDYAALKQGVAAVAKACAELGEKRTVAVISTCLPRTFIEQIEPLLNEFVDYVYTPQFIAMGTVLQDYLNPEFNLIGVRSVEAADLLERFYATINDAPCVRTDVTTAEGIKVSYNTWITAKTVIANAWGEMCERTGMDFDAMKAAWDLADRRLLSSRYMAAGMSDGGGCHPRDNIALSWLAEKADMSFNIWDALMHARQEYEAWHADCVAYLAEQHDLPIVLLGTAFKPETDIETGSAAMLMAECLRLGGERFLHVNDCDYLQKAVYFIATDNERYRSYEFPEGSIVLDPFGSIPDREGVFVKRLGRR